MKIIDKSDYNHSNGTIQLSVEFSRRDLRLIKTPYGLIVELEGTSPSGDIGGPGLPSSVIRVALPQFSEVRGVDAKAVKSEIISKKAEMVAPLQHPRPGVVEEKDPITIGNPEDKKNFPIRKGTLKPPSEPFVEPFPTPTFEIPKVELYEREIKEPRPAASLVATEQVGLAPIALVEVNPVRVNREGLLEFHSRIEVVISYRSVDSKRLFRSEKSGDTQKPATPMIRSRAQARRLVDLARTLVINPDQVPDFFLPFPDLILPADYLIITDNQSWDEHSMTPIGQAGDLVAAFQRLADWKAKRGLSTRAVTISDIVNGQYGNFKSGARDLQEVIRNFLKWAYNSWGISWVLLGGDINIVPVRRVAGASGGHIELQTDDDPPPDNKSYWSGSYLKMHVVNPGTWWPGGRTDHLLVRPDTGLLIPYDSAGTSGSSLRGWYFTIDNTYATQSSTPTQFVRVNGPQSQIRTKLQWLYKWNMLPTDLYYGSLVSGTYGLPGQHDWDLVNNGIYGQHTNDADLDGISYTPDISVGRAPVSNTTQANGFVDKVIAYEQFRLPNGTPLDVNWPRRLLLVSANWGGRFHVSSTSADPPTDNRYYHAGGAAHTLIKLKKLPEDFQWRLIVQVTQTDNRVSPYNYEAATVGRGWHYVKSATDLSPSGYTISIWGSTFHVPIPTLWVAVYGPGDELTPHRYIFDRTGADGSMRDQEELREQIQSELPYFNTIARLYEDEVDLTPGQTAAAPIDHLTGDRVQNALNAGQHFVSLSGHGNSGGCCGLSSNMAQNLTNGYHAFIGYADSCLTNQFDAEDAASEYLLQNANGGAVAYIGNTRFSWIGVGDNFQRKFFNRLTSTRHLGLANDIRGSMVNEWTGYYRLYNKWAIFTLNLMGDPEMPVWISKPRQMKVKFSKVLDKRKSFSIRVQHRVAFINLPLPGAVVHIQQGSFSRQDKTDSLGKVTFDLKSAGLGNLDIIVTHSGYIPFIGQARIAGPAWVYGTVTRVWHRHKKPNHSLIHLHLKKSIDGDLKRGWYVHDSHPDYHAILDAANDAYVNGKIISLFVNNTDEGGTIEKYRFGHKILMLKDDFNLSERTHLQFETRPLPQELNDLAPDGSEIRQLPDTNFGGLAHCTLPPESVSKPVYHKTVEEIWYFLEGQGQVWRKQDDREEVVDVHAGTSLTIPVGTYFQFRNTGKEPLRFVITSMPSRPGKDETVTLEKGYWDVSREES